MDPVHWKRSGSPPKARGGDIFWFAVSRRDEINIWLGLPTARHPTQVGIQGRRYL